MITLVLHPGIIPPIARPDLFIRRLFLEGGRRSELGSDLSRIDLDLFVLSLLLLQNRGYTFDGDLAHGDRVVDQVLHEDTDALARQRQIGSQLKAEHIERQIVQTPMKRSVDEQIS